MISTGEWNSIKLLSLSKTNKMKKIYSSIEYEIYGFCQSKSDLRYDN